MGASQAVIRIEIDAELPATTRVTYQYRFPRSRKRRIRDKWSYRARNYRSADVKLVFVRRVGENYSLLMHPIAAAWWDEVMA